MGQALFCALNSTAINKIARSLSSQDLQPGGTCVHSKQISTNISMSGGGNSVGEKKDKVTVRE